MVGLTFLTTIDDFRAPKKEGDDFKADAETHKKYIFGGHVANYMTSLAEDDEEAYKRQFSRYIALGITGENLEGVYKAAHAAIRKDPNVPRGPKELGAFKTREGDKPKEYPKKQWMQLKLSKKQVAGRVRQKIANMLK